MTDSRIRDLIIVGAGLSGLMAAQVLRGRDLDVLLVDKGRSAGGRLATRRIGPGRADHGAQFFTVRTAELSRWVRRWEAAGLVYRWSTGWSGGSLVADAPDGHPRYAVHGGMNALAKYLAQDLAVAAGVRLVSAMAIEDGWLLQDEAGRVYESRSLLLTPPVPQSLALLDAGGARVGSSERLQLERIEYAPCLAGLFWLDRPPKLPEPGALQRPSAAVPWIADNQRKGISPEAAVVTVHANAEFSRVHWDAPESGVLAAFQAELLPWLAPGTQIIEAQLKRWRYALPFVLHPSRTLLAHDLPPLAFAGDAFGGPRVEGAAVSGMAAGEALALRL